MPQGQPEVNFKEKARQKLVLNRYYGWYVDAGGGPRPVLGEDHLAVRWLPLADPAAALELPWIPADLPIVHALLDHLRG